MERLVRADRATSGVEGRYSLAEVRESSTRPTDAGRSLWPPQSSRVKDSSLRGSSRTTSAPSTQWRLPSSRVGGGQVTSTCLAWAMAAVCEASTEGHSATVPSGNTMSSHSRSALRALPSWAALDAALSAEACDGMRMPAASAAAASVFLFLFMAENPPECRIRMRGNDKCGPALPLWQASDFCLASD
jgi:hypothetical protein